MKRIGLIVNPVAGLGGRVGLKGSDGAYIQQRAVELGAIPCATNRALETLKCLLPMKADLDILTYPGSMGEIAVRQAGFLPNVLGQILFDHTTAEDTKRAVKELMNNDLSLLMFTGGDGTARDIYAAGGSEIPTLGIPAGVKIHSAVYAIHPRAAGELAMAYLREETVLNLAEVMDVNEEEFRQGRVSPKLYGFLKVPYLQRFMQGAKAASPKSLSSALEGIAQNLFERLSPDTIYIFGPGSSTQMIAKYLGMEKNLLGVDVYLDGRVIASDANESTLLELLLNYPAAEIIVTPIGGQGCIFGRGNQQISPQVIRMVGKKNILVVSTPEKLNALKGHPLWVDTGDYEVDKILCGYIPVITGYKEYVMYKVTA
jgi:predicted polyphosphate/ATP-dependent NAD kinase